MQSIYDNRIIRVLKFGLFSTLAITAASAHSATLTCTAKVDKVAITAGGQVYPQFHDMGSPQICNINSNTGLPGGGTLTMETCKVLISMLLSAKLTGKSIVMVMDFGTAPVPACNAIPGFSYAVPSPYPAWMEIGD